jgi:predicted Zn-dependent protease
LSDPASAEKYYRQVLAAAPVNVTAHEALGDVLYDAKKIQEAGKEYLEVVNLKPGSVRIQERLAQMAESSGQNDEAIRRFRLAAGPGGTDSARMSLANLCFNKVPKDLSCARSALEGITDPSRALTVKTMRAQIEFEAKNFDEAGKLANELLTLQPENIILLKIAARVAYEQDKVPDAITLLSKSLSIDPTDQDIRYKLVRVYSNNPELNQLPKAVELLTEGINKYNSDFEAYLLLGNVYRRLGDPPNAKENFGKGMARNPRPEPRLAWAYTGYGLLLYEGQDYEGARVQLTTATQLAPADDVAWYNLALTCLQLNRTEEMMQAQSKLTVANSRYLPLLEQAIAAKAGAVPQPKVP